MIGSIDIIRSASVVNTLGLIGFARNVSPYGFPEVGAQPQPIHFRRPHTTV